MHFVAWTAWHLKKRMIVRVAFNTDKPDKVIITPNHAICEGANSRSDSNLC